MKRFANLNKATRMAGTVFFVIALTMGRAAPVTATPFVIESVYSAGVGADGRGYSIAPTIQAGLLDLTFPTVTAPSGATASAYATSTWHNGALGVLGTTSADVTGVSAGTANAHATMTAATGYVDEILFLSSTLPAFTPISYTIETILTADLDLIGTPSCAPGVPITEGGYAKLVGPAGILMLSFCGETGPRVSATRTFAATVGEAVLINPRLEVGSIAVACVGPFCDEYQLQTIDASHTGSIYITVNTPGVTCVAASGATYQADPAQAVPEPATMSLLGLGLASLGVRRWRQRSRMWKYPSAS